MADRPLNDFGFSIHTIAAEYETDAALTGWPEMFPPDGHYFHAAWAAECEQRDLDRATAQAADERSTS